MALSLTTNWAFSGHITVMILNLGFTNFTLGPPAEAFLYPLTEDRMLTNIDARTNVRLHYDNQIIKYVYHDRVDLDRVDPPPAVTEYTHMAQSHKHSTVARWLTDYLGELEGVVKIVDACLLAFKATTLSPNIHLALPVKSHDFQMEDRYNTVLVTVTNPAFPSIDSLSPEERQERADKDELSTVEFPFCILDNTSTTKKIEEWSRSKRTQYGDQAVKREDFRVEVS